MLFSDLPKGEITMPARLLDRVAALAEFAVRARTHVARDYRKELIYQPEPEAPTRLSQQLSQLAKGSARLARRAIVTESDMKLVHRVAFDCIPSLRWQLLRGVMTGQSRVIPTFTRSYVRDDLREVGLLDDSGHHLSNLAAGLLRRGGVSSLNLPPERVSEKKDRSGAALTGARRNSEPQPETVGEVE